MSSSQIDPAAAEAAALLQKRMDPVTYVRAFWDQGIRPDSRGFKTHRKLNITCGSITTAYGSSMVKCGATSVICAVSGDLVRQLTEDVPAVGRVTVRARVGPLCAPRFHTGRRGPTAEEESLTSFLSQIFVPIASKSRPPVPLPQLTVLEGRFAWALSIEVYHVGYDGNLADPAIIAILAALRNTRLPTVVMHDTDCFVTPECTNSLCLDYFPIPLTMVVLPGEHIVVDPTADEEDCAESLITVVTANDGKVIAVRKHGGVSVSEAQLLTCLDYSYRRVDRVIVAIESAAGNLG